MTARAVRMDAEQLDLPRDDNGRIVGYQVGKAAAMSDWFFRREQKSDRLLFKRLAERKRRMHFTPEQKMAAVLNCARWVAANTARVRANRKRWLARAAKARAYKQREYAKKVERREREKLAVRMATVFACHGCGAQWCIARGPMPRRKPRWCGQPCKSRAQYQAAKRRGTR